MHNTTLRSGSRPVFRSLAPGLLACLALSGCALTGELFLPPTESDVQMGAQVAEQVTQQIGVVEDADRKKYLNQVGDNLVNKLEDRRFVFSFQIVDQLEPNAFAAPGGYIYVSRGLLGLTNSEDELATVMGHEIIHVTRRHTAKQMSKSRVPGLFTLPGRVVGTVLSDDLGSLINAPINTVGSVYLASYSRGQESESDRLGLQLAARAGYAPETLADILGRLEQAVETRTGRQRKTNFFDSHPSTPDRMDNIQKWARNAVRIPGDPVRRGSEDYLRGLDGMILEENPAHGVFQGQKFLHPELDFTLVFPDGWETVNTPAAVGAVAPGKEGVIFVGVQRRGTDPTQAALAFRDKILKKHGVRPNRSEAVEVGDWPGYLLTYNDVSASPPMNLHLLWVTHEGHMFQLIAMAPERLRPKLRDTALSMKPITEEERKSIQVVRLRLAQAKVGETLDDLCQRTGCAYSLGETAVLNGLPVRAALKDGQFVKIASKEPYESGD